MRAYRWGNNDRYFGPFTYARDKGYRHTGMSLCSTDDENRGCHLRISGFGHTFIVMLPNIIQPWRRKVHANWDAATVERLGRDWYYDVHPREYGWSLSGDSGAKHFMLYLGRQTHDSSTTQSWSCFLPWTEWRHVRHSLYDMDGKHFADMPESRRMLDTWEERKALEAACPSATFEFLDFDGQKLVVQTRIEEREWRAGEGWFKWLSWFRRPKIARSLDLRFSEEVGKRKGSWKGGTIGHSIEMEPGELHASAFRRYCAENALTFVGVMGQGDIPHGVYWHEDAFYSRMTDADLGAAFREAWQARRDEFPGKPVRPQHDEAAIVRKD